MFIVVRKMKRRSKLKGEKMNIGGSVQLLLFVCFVIVSKRRICLEYKSGELWPLMEGEKGYPIKSLLSLFLCETQTTNLKDTKSLPFFFLLFCCEGSLPHFPYFKVFCHKLQSNNKALMLIWTSTFHENLSLSLSKF